MSDLENELTETIKKIANGNERSKKDMDDYKDLLDEYDNALSEAFECLNNEAAGSSERKNEAEVIEKLVRAKVAIMQFEADKKDKEERRRIDEEKNIKNFKIEEEKAKKPVSDKLLDIGGKVLLGVLNTGVTLYALKVIMEFESGGTLRSKGGREFRIFQPLALFKG